MVPTQLRSDAVTGTTWMSRWRHLVVWVAAPGVAVALATITSRLALGVVVVGAAAIALQCCHQAGAVQACLP